MPDPLLLRAVSKRNTGHEESADGPFRPLVAVGGEISARERAGWWAEPADQAGSVRAQAGTPKFMPRPTEIPTAKNRASHAHQQTKPLPAAPSLQASQPAQCARAHQPLLFPSSPSRTIAFVVNTTL
ncbi:hypothetical protein FA95DRAFT_297372 [Auriscalpium vulgare]|uniref:Uncharacterized protein n=1 Tax=Auriscalpium vulgare TaxID=40419 RepID=A0ACB8RKG0_9AGAM|nr:hypothetical protein FA95DRAFT_297372 [Auriscalpium vulgare]